MEKEWGRKGDVMKTPLSQVVGTLRLCNPPASRCLVSGPPLTGEDIPVFKIYLMSIPIEPIRPRVFCNSAAKLRIIFDMAKRFPKILCIPYEIKN